MVGVTPTFATWVTGMPDLRSSLLSRAAAVSAGLAARAPAAVVPSFRASAESGPQKAVMPAFHEPTARTWSK